MEPYTQAYRDGLQKLVTAEQSGYLYPTSKPKDSNRCSMAEIEVLSEEVASLFPLLELLLCSASTTARLSG